MNDAEIAALQAQVEQLKDRVRQLEQLVRMATRQEPKQRVIARFDGQRPFCPGADWVYRA